MKNVALAPVVLSLLAAVAVACGSTETVIVPAPAAAPTDEPPVATADASTPPPVVDHGEVSTTYPAFKPAMGQLVNNGGSVLVNPVIVTVTWPGDEQADTLEGLGDTIGAGAYWSAVTAEYGSKAAVSGADNHVRLTTAAPTSISDSELQDLVKANVESGAFPTPATGNPVYILYLPTSMQLILQGQSACSQGVGGYHDSVTASGKDVAYAIVPRCSNDFESVTVAASHELAEAATDPYPQTQPAWYGFRNQDLAWEFFQQFQSENGDACEFYRDSELLPGAESGLTYHVQRQWSNKSAAAGHDPCVPAYANRVFYNTTPLGLEDVDVDLSQLGGGKVTTKGYNIAVGETRTIALGLYSDGPLKAWDIKAIAGGIASRQTATVDLSLDVTSGQNGEKAYLTITVNSAGRTGSELVSIVSTYQGTPHYMPILIGSSGATKK
ncbi:MAG: hypothetical protein JWP97_4883 [Labilithrix sp.]|nr:hypothetical protein [Labilithrix sp.]